MNAQLVEVLTNPMLGIHFSLFAAITSPTVPSDWALTTWRCQRCPWQWGSARWLKTSVRCGGRDLRPAWCGRGSSRARQTQRGWQRWRSNPGEGTHTQIIDYSEQEYLMLPPQTEHFTSNKILFREILFTDRILAANYCRRASRTFFLWLECMTFLQTLGHSRS